MEKGPDLSDCRAIAPLTVGKNGPHRWLRPAKVDSAVKLSLAKFEVSAKLRLWHVS